MELKKIFLLTCSLSLLAACGGDGDDDEGGNPDGLVITLEDAQRHRVGKSVRYSYTGGEIAAQANPGSAGKGATWDFSGVDLSDYDYKMKLEWDGKQIDYSTSLYKDYYPKATECYATRHTNTYPDNGVLAGYYDYYTYFDGNTEYGGVQDNAIDGTLRHDVSIWNYTSPLNDSYPHYVGVKYTHNSPMVLTAFSDGKPTSSTGSSFLFHIDVEVDGEGTLIMPGGTKLTDVLRYKISNYTDDGIVLQYVYTSKEMGDMLSLSKEAAFFEYLAQ